MPPAKKKKKAEQGTFIFINRTGQEKQYQNISLTVYNFWHVEHFLLSPTFWVFILILPAYSVALFLSTSQICEKRISSQIETCFSILSHVYSWAYVQAHVWIIC